jgi:glycosyltransferase involved in cell wall biosynthesis
MRIAILAENFPPRSGGISVAHEALGRLLSTKHTVRYYAFDDTANNIDSTVYHAKGNRYLAFLTELLLVAKVRRHAKHGNITHVRGIARTFASVRNMTRDISRFKPDITITSDHQVPLLGLNNISRSKIIWVAHHNYTRFSQNPLIPVDCEYDLFLSHRLERRAAKRCDFAVFPSHYMETVFRNTLNTTVPGKVIRNYSLPPHPAAPSPEARKKWSIPEGHTAILLPSGGSLLKGARFFPEIARRLTEHSPNICFCITGHIDPSITPEIDYLRSFCKILTPGKLPHKENLEFSSATDLCISPTLIENYSCAILECQAMGLPVITFDVGGNKEIVADDESGWVVNLYDVNKIIAKARLLIESDQTRKSMSERARHQAKTLNSAEKIISKYEEIFSFLI